MRTDSLKPTPPHEGENVRTEIEYESAKGCLCLGGLLVLLSVLSVAAIVLLGDFQH